MIANLHTHTSFSDGKNTPEEIVEAAIGKGFSAIGFSDHGYTPFDLRYCMKKPCDYIREICRLKKKYRKDIQIYLGVEEDASALLDRSKFDYIIGSSHYFCIDGEYYPIDSSCDYFSKCLQAFNYDVIRLAECYYDFFVKYITVRKPNIIGHFDLITKFDELESSLFLQNEEYNKIAEKYIAEAAKSGSIFELNTGAIARNFRTSPYPAANLLHILKKLNVKLILSSDSHDINNLDFGFDEAKKYLRDLGFTELFTIYNGEFAGYSI